MAETLQYDQAPQQPWWKTSKARDSEAKIESRCDIEINIVLGTYIPGRSRVVASSRNSPHRVLPTLRLFLPVLLKEILKPAQYK